MVRDPSSRSSVRRWLILAACLFLGVALGVTSVVPPRRSRAVVAVSRLGATVRLLPAGLSLSFLPLEKRILLPREHDGAVIEAPVSFPLPGGAALPARVRLLVGGSGTLPLPAEEVRRLGWNAAWGAWLADHLHFTPEQTERLLRSSPLWREIFAATTSEATPDPGPALAPLLAPLQLRHAEIELTGADDVIRAAARQQVARQARPQGRLVVLGLDALSWDLVDDLLARGVMPNLKLLVQRGAQAVEDVPRPLISPVVWTTIATGLTPEQHGVLDFLEPDPAGGAPHPVSSASRKAPTIWEMAAAAGRSTAVIGWWATFPAQAPPGGTVYSDRLTEQLLGLEHDVPRLADPADAAAAARTLAVRASDVTAAMLAPYLTVRPDELQAVRDGRAGWDDPIGGLAKLVAATLTVERLTDRELGRGTQVVLSYLEGTDTVGHLFAPFRSPAMPGIDPALARRFGDVVDRYHHEVDAWIGRVVGALGPDDTLVIVSDHGFTWGHERPRVPSGAHTATAVMWHLPEGFFLAVGPRVAHTPRRERLGVLDVAPALLALDGLPSDPAMPGHVPTWLLRPGGGSGAAAVNYARLLPPRQAVRVELPAAAREEELAKLRALGYLAGGNQPAPAPQPSSPGAPPPTPVVAPAQPAVDRAESRRLTNLGTSRASNGDRTGAEQAFRQAIAADPGYAPAHYNLSLVLRNQGRLDDADEEFWRAVQFGVGEREMAVVQLALDYTQRGMPDKAQAVFAEGRRRFPESAIIWLNSGVFLGEHGDLPKARECLERAVVLAPSNPAAHRNLAAALLALGDREGARRQIAESLRLDPNQPALREQLDALGRPPSP